MLVAVPAWWLAVWSFAAALMGAVVGGLISYWLERGD